MSQVREEHVKNKCHLKEVPDPFMSLPVVPVENAKPKSTTFKAKVYAIIRILEDFKPKQMKLVNRSEREKRIVIMKACRNTLVCIFVE